MAKYLTRQRKRLLEYLSEHTDEQISAADRRRSGSGSDQHQRCLPQHLRFGGRGTSQTQRAGRDKSIHLGQQEARQPISLAILLADRLSFKRS